MSPVKPPKYCTTIHHHQVCAFPVWSKRLNKQKNKAMRKKQQHFNKKHNHTMVHNHLHHHHHHLCICLICLERSQVIMLHASNTATKQSCPHWLVKHTSNFIHVPPMKPPSKPTETQYTHQQTHTQWVFYYTNLIHKQTSQ